MTAENFGVYLMPCITVPRNWFGEIKGKKLLGLASGGGQQMPVFAKLGAVCTVFDYSDRQLDAEHMVSRRENTRIRAAVYSNSCGEGRIDLCDVDNAFIRLSPVCRARRR